MNIYEKINKQREVGRMNKIVLLHIALLTAGATLISVKNLFYLDISLGFLITQLISTFGFLTIVLILLNRLEKEK